MEAVRRPPSNNHNQVNKINKISEYVTVVAVGASGIPPQEEKHVVSPSDPSGFVTVLKIGDTPSISSPSSKTINNNINNNNIKGVDDYCVEQVLVYRLPGERLGFGLKFEGGTKAAEFVKRLFIQSCAPDSPASRVRGTWGVLTEGDEVLAIDNVKVTSMTRIDCVRCLKDSNVVIKLQVRHKLTSNEAPLVISAEKKRTPPPPPPVPPRKGPRKKDLHAPLPPKGFGDSDESTPVPQVRNMNITSTQVVHPPDAEVYLDLFSQEQESYCLSESDDTGSSISTVVDRFGSFPTTTTSSFAGSMPSTPTAVQRRIQHTNPFDVEHSPDEELLFERLVSLQAKEHHVTLQPPANFQDAPLSYADEDVRVVEAAVLTVNHGEKSKGKKRPPPPPPPRSKHVVPSTEIDLKEKLEEIETNNNDYNHEDENVKVLPRLVDFVPKSTKVDGETNDDSKVFIEQEQMRHTDNFFLSESHDDEDEYIFGWSSSQPLATIGEADNEDESLQDVDTAPSDDHSQRLSEEIVRTELEGEKVDYVDGCQVNATTEDTSSDESEENNKAPEPAPRTTLKQSKTDVDDTTDTENNKMDTRQPPDGHEFPDYHQEATTLIKPVIPRRSINVLPRGNKEQTKTNVKNMIAMFSHNEEVTSQPAVTINGDSTQNNVKETKHFESSFEPSPMKRGSMSDLTSEYTHTTPLNPLNPIETNKLHKRSQSLVDISSSNDRFSQIVDQRRRGLSKLKGLIIPEHPDVAPSNTPIAMIDLPEIKSAIEAVPEFRPPSIPATLTARPHHARNNSTPSLNFTTTPLWSTDVECAKYSPAFKRKTLQVYSTKPVEPAKEATSSDEECRLPSADAPKSLESITSPTRSDCSFEYASMGSMGSGSSPSTTNTPASKITKSEDESDNDSAVSSSQSSYISRQSPPASPNHLYDSAANRRLLKAQSVEAINRKNILASAKCRSGKDLNGSPLLIQRKFDEPDSPPVDNNIKPEQILIVEQIEHVDVDVDVEDDKTVKPAQNGVCEVTSTKTVEIQEIRMIKPPRVSKLTSEVKEVNKPVMKTDDRLSSKFFTSRNNAKAASVTDLRKNFEKSSPVQSNLTMNTSSIKTNLKKPTNNTSITRPMPSKRNSLPSMPTTAKTIVKLQDKQNIIASTVKSWDDESISSADVKVIALRPEIPGGSIGITLAGGTDYETKDITIHKVRNGSVAHRDGRLRKGERVLSINGKSMNAITHAESMAILKEPVLEVIIVTSPPRTDVAPSVSPTTPTRDPTRISLLESIPVTTSSVVTAASGDVVSDVIQNDKPIIAVKLIKDPLSTASGLGFSMEGGRGSPQGDVPLLIKKLFTGGLADKSGMLAVGDELVEIQGTDVTEMPRIDAWSLMKKLPPGEVTLKVRR